MCWSGLQLNVFLEGFQVIPQKLFQTLKEILVVRAVRVVQP